MNMTVELVLGVCACRGVVRGRMAASEQTLVTSGESFGASRSCYDLYVLPLHALRTSES